MLIAMKNVNPQTQDLLELLTEKEWEEYCDEVLNAIQLQYGYGLYGRLLYNKFLAKNHWKRKE
jgi:hypothetical protein